MEERPQKRGRVCWLRVLAGLEWLPRDPPRALEPVAYHSLRRNIPRLTGVQWTVWTRWL